jgi:transposase
VARHSHWHVRSREEEKREKEITPGYRSCRWVVERSFAWMTRFRRLARDYERLPETLAGLHLLAFTVLIAHKVHN